MAWGAAYLVYFAVMLYICGDVRCARTTTHTATDSISFLDRPLPYQMRWFGLLSGFILLSLGIMVYAAARADDRLFLIQIENLCLYTVVSLWIFSIAKTYYRQMARQSPPGWIATALVAICVIGSPAQFMMLGLSHAMEGSNQVRFVLIAVILTSVTAFALAIMLLLVTISLRSHLLQFIASASGTVDTTYLQVALRRLMFPVIFIDLIVAVGGSMSIYSVASDISDPGTIEQYRADDLALALDPITILYFVLPLAAAFQGWAPTAGTTTTTTTTTASTPKTLSPGRGRGSTIAVVSGGTGLALPSPTAATLAPASATAPPRVSPSEPVATVTVSIPLAASEFPPPAKRQSLMA